MQIYTANTQTKQEKIQSQYLTKKMQKIPPKEPVSCVAARAHVVVQRWHFAN
jgi:hypothetical protein